MAEAYQINRPHFPPEADFLDTVPRKGAVPAAKVQPLMLQLRLQPLQ